jgi:predicted amidohydrolase YtcJ
MTVRLGVSTFIQRPGQELTDFRAWTERYRPREGDDWLRLIGGGEMLVRSIYDFEIFNRPQVVPPARAEADLEPVIRLLVEKGWSFRFHATYDETVGRHLDVLERVHRDQPIDGLRWICDHGETLSQRNMERIARMGGGIAVQNRIAFQEREFLARYGAERAEQAPPLRRMLEMGIPVGAGTDMSRVSSYNPGSAWNGWSPAAASGARGCCRTAPRWTAWRRCGSGRTMPGSRARKRARAASRRGCWPTSRCWTATTSPCRRPRSAPSRAC